MPASANVVVNATSLGLPGSGKVPLSFDVIPMGLVVCDVIPNPPDTFFLQRALRLAPGPRWPGHAAQPRGDQRRDLDRRRPGS